MFFDLLHALFIQVLSDISHFGLQYAGKQVFTGQKNKVLLVLQFLFIRKLHKLIIVLQFYMGTMHFQTTNH